MPNGTNHQESNSCSASAQETYPYGIPPPATTVGIALCVPVFNDWSSAQMLLDKLGQIASELHPPVRIFFVDDGSTDAIPDALGLAQRSTFDINVIQLRCNVGHQRAIALGLAFIHQHCPCQFVVVMDGDGEDAPRDILKLVERCKELSYSRLVFARRAKRTEGMAFRCGYQLYKCVQLLLTGRVVNVGNFCVIPSHLMAKLLGSPELWNHFVAAVYHVQLPTEAIPIERASRLSGRSKMSFVALVTHGMSAISVFGSTVGVRLLFVTCALVGLLLAALASVVWIRLFTDWAIPGWATNAFGLVSLMLVNLLTLITVFILFVLQSRTQSRFIPLRDWEYFVLGRRTFREP